MGTLRKEQSTAISLGGGNRGIGSHTSRFLVSEFRPDKEVVMKPRTIIRRQLSLFTLFLLVLLAGSTSLLSGNAAYASAPTVKPAYPHIVDAAFVAEYATVPRRKDVSIIDARPARKFEKGHIVPSINIPLRQFDQSIVLLPEDKSTLLIYYCGGYKCPLSHKSAFKAEKLGYTNVKVYAAGYPDWLKHGNIPGVGAKYVRNLISSETLAMVVDARPAKKFRGGSVPTAINIPYRKFDKMKGFLPADKSVELIFFCGGYKCPLSPKSATKAMEMGYTNVKLYQAGYPLWKEMYGASGVAPAQTATTDTKGSMPIQKFTRLMREEPDSVYWIDVRERSEIAADGTFKTKTAKVIPMDELEAAIPSLPTDKPIVFFCANGVRSADAYDVLKEKGSKLEAYYLEAVVAFGKHDLPKVTAAK